MAGIQEGLTQAQKELDSAKQIKLLITGKTGSGKSTLVNSMLGVESFDGSIAEESEETDPCTTEVTEYTVSRNGVELSIWDSPGFQDGTNQKEYLEQIKVKCVERDLTIMCIQCGGQNRFVCSKEDSNVATMVQLTNAFGKEFWKNAVIVLTFTNTIESFNPRWSTYSSEKVQEEFAKKIKQWTDRIHKALLEVVGLEEAEAKKVKIYPAGHYTKPDLPGIKLWLSALFFDCVTGLPECAQAAMIKANKDRFKFQKDVDQQELAKQPASKQPIIIDRLIHAGGSIVGGTILGGGSALVGGALGAGGGALVGSTAGTVTAVVNAIGMEALIAATVKGVAVGAVIGTGVGIGIGAIGLGLGVYLAVRYLTGKEKIKKD